MLRRAALLAARIQRSQTNRLEAACPACLATQLLSDVSRSQSQWSLLGGSSSSRGFANYEPDSDDGELSTSSPRVNKLAEEILHLNLIEVADLTEILQKRLNISAPQFVQGGGFPQGPGVVPAAAAAAPEEKAPEKTEFDVKLVGFDAASKIKVIKEIRGVTELGLKEAKELVEKSPIVVKAGLTKEDAEALKKKLEAVGGKVSLE